MLRLPTIDKVIETGKRSQTITISFFWSSDRGATSTGLSLLKEGTYNKYIAGLPEKCSLEKRMAGVHPSPASLPHSCQYSVINCKVLFLICFVSSQKLNAKAHWAKAQCFLQASFHQDFFFPHDTFLYGIPLMGCINTAALTNNHHSFA